MTTQALLETLPNHRFRVTGSGRFAVYGEGNTPDEAVNAFRDAARKAKIITVEIADSELLSTKATSITADEISKETWDDFLALIEQQRQEDNARYSEKNDTE